MSRSTIAPRLAARARSTILALLDGAGPGTGPGRCTECHCLSCLEAAPHRCATTRLLDDLAAAARVSGDGRERK